MKIAMLGGGGGLDMSDRVVKEFGGDERNLAVSVIEVINHTILFP